MSRTLVQFGAGNIGRGFLAPLFTAAGWRVVFVDIDRPRIAALHERGAYQVDEVTNETRHQRHVAPVDGILASDAEAVATTIAAADLVATAVGLGALPHIGAAIAAGLARRSTPLDVLVCENGIQAPDILRQAIATALDDETALDRLGLVRTSIGRMIPPPPADADLLDIVVEPYAKLPVEATAFRGTAPTSVPGLHLAEDFELVLRQKLYLHNLSHACAAYAGQRRGHADLPACMADADLVAGVTAASREAIEGLARAHGTDAAARERIRRECETMLADLLVRYRNRALGDPVARVARDPLRKLAGDDRLIGAARLCLSQGIEPLALAHHILAACAYRAAADEPGYDRFTDLQRAGWRALLRAAAQLDDKEPLMATLDIAARQREAADQIQAAGIFLQDDEITAIEIADFGLGRFDELGLAIHIYVNTDRCCAKELAMLPKQVCPEHRHPRVDGEEGKEETFRVRSGSMHLFVPGEHDDAAKDFARSLLPTDKHDSIRVFGHVELGPGDQYTLAPNTPHWFVAGDAGCVVSEFSTRSRDEADIFTDKEIQRMPDAG